MIVIACGLFVAAAVLIVVLAWSTASPKGPTRVASVASVRPASARRICATAKSPCVSGCLLPVAAVTPVHARAGECAPAGRASRPCRLFISNEEHTPGTSDDSFCGSRETLLRGLNKGRAKVRPRAKR